MFGDRLKLARKKAGYSLRGLSDALDGHVTAQALGKYERDAMMPSSGVLIRLAKILDVSLEYLLSEQVEELEAVEFRKRSGTLVGERARVSAEVTDCLQRYLTIEEILKQGGHVRDGIDTELPFFTHVLGDDLAFVFLTEEAIGALRRPPYPAI